jgi:hypothetical protein
LILDYFALLILLVLGGSIIAGLILLGMMPGRIAKARNHPQSDAICACGWWGLLTMGLLLPIAYIWAYSRPMTIKISDGMLGSDNSGAPK